MKQHSLGLGMKAKRTRRREFLDEMEKVVPWAELVALVSPYLPDGKRGRPPFPCETMLRIHFMQQWFALSDPAMEEALHDMPVFREFAGLEGWDERLPDESKILRFRHVLEKHKLAVQILQTVNDLLSAKGVMLKSGTVVDATLIAAPSSTKNGSGERDPDPTDVSDEEWSFAAPYLTLMDQHAPQREHDLREVFNALRWLVRAGAPWRMLPNDLPPWEAVYQQSRRWLDAGCFEAMVSDLRSIIRVAQGRQGQPSAVVMDGRTLQSSCESGPRAGYDGYKRKRGSKVHMAVDTLGHLLAVHVTPADEQERAQVQRLCEDVQQATGHMGWEVHNTL